MDTIARWFKRVNPLYVSIAFFAVLLFHVVMSETTYILVTTNSTSESPATYVLRLASLLLLLFLLSVHFLQLWVISSSASHIVPRVAMKVISLTGFVMSFVILFDLMTGIIIMPIVVWRSVGFFLYAAWFVCAAWFLWYRTVFGWGVYVYGALSVILIWSLFSDWSPPYLISALLTALPVLLNTVMFLLIRNNAQPDENSLR